MLRAAPRSAAPLIVLRASTLGASPHLLCASPGVAAVLEPREAELEQGAAARSHPAEEPSSTVQSQQSPDFRCFGGSRSHRALRLPLFSCCGCCCFFFHWSIVGSFLFLLRKLLGRCARAPWCASSRSEAAFCWGKSPQAALPCSGAALQAVCRRGVWSLVFHCFCSRPGHACCAWAESGSAECETQAAIRLCRR